MKQIFIILALLASPAWGQSYYSPFMQQQMQSDDQGYRQMNMDMQNRQIQSRLDEQQRQMDDQMIQMEVIRDKMQHPELFSDK